MSDAVKIFDGLVAADSPAKYIFAHPVLLSSALHKLVAPNLTSEVQKRTLYGLVEITKQIKETPLNYPIGPGPIEGIYDQIRRGEITKSRALTLAAGAPSFVLLSPIYVRHLSIAAERNAQDNDWETGIVIEQLILSALDARRGQVEWDQAEMDFIAVVHWLDIVARAVWDVPDGTLFHDAVRRAERLTTVIEDPGYFYPSAEILNRLGILYLDPYVYARQNNNYEQQWRLWQQRLDQQRDRAMLGSVSDSDRIPRAEVALPKAVICLRRAALHRSGVKRGLTLKALVQALVWQYAIGLSPDPLEVETLAAEALHLLPSKGYDSARTEIENLLQWNAQESRSKQVVSSSTLDNARQMVLRPLNRWLAHKSPQDVIQLFMQTASAVTAHPDLALKLWLAVATLIPDQDEQLQSTYYNSGRDYVRRALAGEETPPDGQTLLERIALVQALGRDSYSTAAMVFALAASSGATDEEEDGAEAINLVSSIDTKFSEEFQGLLLYTRSVLRHDAAVSALHRDQLGDATRLYMLSAYDHLSNRLPQRALDAFEDAFNLTSDGNSEAIKSFVAFIAEVAIRLEQQLGDRIAYKLQVIYRTLLARIVQRPINSVLLLFFLQTAKGNAFSHALASGGLLSWLESKEATRLEEGIRDFAQRVAPEPWGQFDEGTLLTAYVTKGEAYGGATPGQKLRNMQIEFDAEVNRHLIPRDVQEQSSHLTDATLQAYLGPSTVLISHYLGVESTGRPALFTLFSTREDFDFTSGIVPNLFSGSIVYGDSDNGSVVSSPFSGFVASVRESVQEEPGPRAASDKALTALKAQETNFFGGRGKNKLEVFRNAGKDHLCICPHGPLHFFPYHLMGPEDHPLAEDWTITYLPNLTLLDSSRIVNRRNDALITIGLDFSANNSLGLPQLSGPEEEAREIAQATGCPSLVGAAVSRDSVMNALQRYSRIHVATHGDIQVSAPSFQCLYLSAEDTVDRLNAYEILRLDLRGVDLVTLSACETALGRFDYGDNLRGIPASLLIAGASTIIGTLWPVETNSARTFFTSLYSQLKGPVTKGEAFHVAQKETRKLHPQYRDWGAFYLIGSIT